MAFSSMPNRLLASTFLGASVRVSTALSLGPDWIASRRLEARRCGVDEGVVVEERDGEVIRV